MTNYSMCEMYIKRRFLSNPEQKLLVEMHLPCLQSPWLHLARFLTTKNNHHDSL